MPPAFLEPARKLVREWRERARYTKGIPEALSLDTLNDVTRSCTGDEPVSASYRHTSGWKSDGAFRIRVKLRNGSVWTFIFKVVTYDLERIPALEGLPIHPGTPEFWIYSTDSETLKDYLPDVYFCQKHADNVRFIYCLEDLWPRFSSVSCDADILHVSDSLSRMHGFISQALSPRVREHLINYDIDFSTKLFRYVIDALGHLDRYGESQEVEAFFGDWVGIEKLYLTNMELAYSEVQQRLIHGDSNLTNIFLGRSDRRSIRLIDWEWAGIGLPHMDLASALKNASPELEAQAIRAFSNGLSSKDIQIDRKTYYWCKLQRALFDAAFFVKQQKSALGREPNSLRPYIDKAARRAALAASELSTLSRH